MAETPEAAELLEWRDHDSISEITYTGFGPYMVEKLAEDSFRIWLPDDTKTARLMVGEFYSRKSARTACQSDVDGRRMAEPISAERLTELVADYHRWKKLGRDADTLTALLELQTRRTTTAGAVIAKGQGGTSTIRPLSTYPESRDKMLALCAAVEKSCDDSAAVELADLVKGILEDEAYAA